MFIDTSANKSTFVTAKFSFATILINKWTCCIAFVFYGKHSFIKPVAKLYFAGAKVLLFALVLINVSILRHSKLRFCYSFDKRINVLYCICFLWQNICLSKLWQNCTFRRQSAFIRTSANKCVSTLPRQSTVLPQFW